MKYFGSILDFTDERNEDLMRAFRACCSRAERIYLPDICRSVVDSPSKRFWVSPMRAMIVCSQIARGIPVLDTMRPTKREMFQEIYSRFAALSAKRPDAPMIDIAAEVVNSPAPKFYMEPSSALERISKIRNGWYGKSKDRGILR